MYVHPVVKPFLLKPWKEHSRCPHTIPLTGMALGRYSGSEIALCVIQLWTASSAALSASLPQLRNNSVGLWLKLLQKLSPSHPRWHGSWTTKHRGGRPCFYTMVTDGTEKAPGKPVIRCLMSQHHNNTWQSLISSNVGAFCHCCSFSVLWISQETIFVSQGTFFLLLHPVTCLAKGDT